MTTHLCQLARDWPGDLPATGLMAEQKIDGWRALYYRNWRGEPCLFTRNGHRIEGAGHIVHRLETMERVAGEPMMFDGEFQVAGSLDATKRWCEREWKGGGEAGQFFAFDCLPFDEWREGGSDRPLHERKAMLERLAAEAQGDGWEWRPGSRGRDEKSPPVIVLPDTWAVDAYDVLTTAREVWRAGGEGLMLKDAFSPYRRNRNAAWLKVKAEGPWWKRLKAAA